jgi:hypothetical protein
VVKALKALKVGSSWVRDLVSGLNSIKVSTHSGRTKLWVLYSL